MSSQMKYYDYMEILYTKTGQIKLKEENYDIYTKDPEFVELLANVKHIQLDDEFNMPLDFLPHGVISISTGANFNQPLNNLPLTVKNIKISSYISSMYDWRCDFNQELNGLHYGLEELILINANNGNYHKPIDNLPPTLKYLKIINSLFSELLNDDSPLDINMLPEMLVSLELIYVSVSFNVNRLPERLMNIKLKPSYHDINSRNKWLQEGYEMLRRIKPNLNLLIKKI